MDENTLTGPDIDSIYEQFDNAAMPTLRRYRNLAWDEMPTRKLLKEHGYQGKIRPFYRGSNTGPALADLYVDAFNYGWRKALNQRYIPTEGNPHLHRLGLSSTAQILLPGNITVNSLRQVIAAYKMLHFEPHQARDIVYYPHGDKLLKLIFERNNYHDLAEMPVEQVAFCIVVLGNVRNIATTDSKMLNWNWKRIAHVAAWDHLTENGSAASPFFQLFRRYTFAEIMQLSATVEEFNVNTIARMNILRSDTALGMDEVVTYLNIPNPLFKDLFGEDPKPWLLF